MSILDDIDKRYGQKLKLNEVINLNDILSFSSSEFPHENKIIDALKDGIKSIENEFSKPIQKRKRTFEL